MKSLSAKQAGAASRALRRAGLRMPAVGRCTTIRKTGKSKSFGALPGGVTVEICNTGRGFTAHSVGPKRRKRRR